MTPTPDAFDLTGKRILVTGGARGLGLIMARAFAARGADLVLASRNGDACAAAAKEVADAFGTTATGVALDVADAEAIPGVITQVWESGPLDVVVNNAGTSWGAPAHEMPTAAWDKVFAVNARGAFVVAREVAKRWIDAERGGTILNVASIAGLNGSPPEILDAAGYSAAKGALIALTRDLAVKWARHDIRVNALAPGFFPTDMTRVVMERAGDRLRRVVPLGRAGEAEDLEGAAVFLASDASRYITGHTLVVDGGMTAQ